MKRGGRHQENDSDGDTAQRCDVDELQRVGKLPERLRERDCQLETEQGLRPGNDDPRLGEHLLDLSCQRRRFSSCMALFRLFVRRMNPRPYQNIPASRQNALPAKRAAVIPNT